MYYSGTEKVYSFPIPLAKILRMYYSGTEKVYSFPIPLSKILWMYYSSTEKVYSFPIPLSKILRMYYSGTEKAYSFSNSTFKNCIGRCLFSPLQRHKKEFFLFLQNSSFRIRAGNSAFTLKLQK
jgi:hypothetical protein